MGKKRPKFNGLSMKILILNFFITKPLKEKEKTLPMLLMIVMEPLGMIIIISIIFLFNIFKTYFLLLMPKMCKKIFDVVSNRVNNAMKEDLKADFTRDEMVAAMSSMRSIYALGLMECLLCSSKLIGTSLVVVFSSTFLISLIIMVIPALLIILIFSSFLKLIILLGFMIIIPLAYVMLFSKLSLNTHLIKLSISFLPLYLTSMCLLSWKINTDNILVAFEAFHNIHNTRN